MEVMGVISKISDPTPWCADVVVVPKRSGGVRIFVDLKPLNQNVLRSMKPYTTIWCYYNQCIKVAKLKSGS